MFSEISIFEQVSYYNLSSWKHQWESFELHSRAFGTDHCFWC
jgi:hypothetical protein